MKGQDTARTSFNNRQLLRTARNATPVLELWEFNGTGADSYGDADYVSLYACACRLVCEGCPAIGEDRRRVHAATGWQMPSPRDVPLSAQRRRRRNGHRSSDLFAGSGNTLHWLFAPRWGYAGTGFRVGCRSVPAQLSKTSWP